MAAVTVTVTDGNSNCTSNGDQAGRVMSHIKRAAQGVAKEPKTRLLCYRQGGGGDGCSNGGNSGGSGGRALSERLGVAEAGT